MNRNHQSYCILSEDQVRTIHDRSLELLESVGIKVSSVKALDILSELGCDTGNPERVKIPHQAVEQALERMPSTIDLFDRSGNPALTLKAGIPYFGTGADCPNVYDLETGERRPSTKADTEMGARLADAMPNLDFVMCFALAGDIPAHCRHVHQYEAMLLNTEKPCLVGCDNADDVKTMIDMAAAVAGGHDALRKKPPMLFLSGSIEPLVHHEEGLSKAFAGAEAGMPFLYMASGNLMGSATPVTMAAALIQSNASTLAGWTIIQNAYPGAKVVGGGVCPAFDMNHGTYCFGSPEFSISGAAKADLCRFYDVPGFGFAGATDSKVLDAQAGFEYAMSLYHTAAGGMSLIHDCGYMDGGSTNSFESVLFADEAVSFVKHLLKPLVFDENTIALDIIDQVGPGGTYLTHQHTFKNFRKHLWLPRYLYRGRYDNWIESGAKDVHTRLNEEVSKILGKHSVPELPEAVKSEVLRIVKTYEEQDQVERKEI